MTQVPFVEREWFEVRNVSGTEVNLAGLTVEESNSPWTFQIPNLPALILSAGHHFVFGYTSDTTANRGVDVDYVLSTGHILPTLFDLTIKDGTSTAVITRLTYDNLFPITSGKSGQLSSAIGANGAGHQFPWYWCDSTSLMSGGDYGSPGAANGYCSISVTPPVDWCQTLWPLSATFNAGEALTVYGRLYEPSVTDLVSTNDFYPLVTGEVSFGSSSDPLLWTWTTGEFNVLYSGGSAPEDEMVGAFVIPSAGSYFYGYRFTLVDPDTGSPSGYLFCDLDGSFGGTNWGKATVNAP